MIPDLLKKQLSSVIIIVGAFFFLFIYSIPYSQTANFSREFNNHHIIFNSPDETANAYFTSLWSEETTMRTSEPLAYIAPDIVHPRSVRVENDSILPISFPGMFYIYGFIGKVFGNESILYLTAFFAILGVLAFYGMNRRVFSEKVGFISTLLLLIHPAYWYFSGRGFLPNVLSTSLLIIGFYLLVVGYQKYREITNTATSFVFFFLSGVFFAFTLLVRPNELVGIFGILIIFAIFYVRSVKVFHLVCFFSPLISGILFLFFHNMRLYGSIFATGYGSIVSSGGSNIDILENFLLPFGFQPKLLVQNVFDYGMRMFWWFTLFFLLGVLLKWWESRKMKMKDIEEHWLVYTLIVFWGILFWFWYYGNWRVLDNINADKTIGVAYVRYWIPVYVLGIPFVSFFFIKISDLFRNSIVRYCVTLFLLLSFVLLSSSKVLYSKDDGWKDMRATIRSYYEVEKKVGDAIEPYAILVVDRSDKIFWPNRKVISYMGNDEIFPGVRALIEKNHKVYYYLHTHLKTEMYEKLKYGALAQSGLMMRIFREFKQGDVLYEIVKE